MFSRKNEWSDSETAFRARREASEGTAEFPFFRHFFVKQQRNGIFAFTERAQLGEAVGNVVKISGCFFF